VVESSGGGLGGGYWVRDGLHAVRSSCAEEGSRRWLILATSHRNGGSGTWPTRQLGGGVLIDDGLYRLVGTAVAQCGAQQRAEALERDERAARGKKSTSLHQWSAVADKSGAENHG
jgi:hypothetical protein